MVKGFSEIDFGFASAEAESAEAPHLLVDGYWDIGEAANKAQFGREYLFLGYKGSGKTAIAKNVELKNLSNPNVFIEQILLGDFPFTPFSKIIKGDIEPEAKYPTAWAWVLLIKILGSLSKDQGVRHPDQARFTEAINALRAVGLLDSAELANIVRASSKNNFSIKIPQIVEFEKGESQKNSPQDISFYVESFLKIVLQASTDSQHIIFIDGLDDIMTRRSAQFDALGGLIIEIGRLNAKFKSSGIPIKINCLCRADVFEKISNPNLNKPRMDYSVVLDWFDDPNIPGESMLVQALDKRCSIAEVGPDVIAKFFPPTIKGSSITQYLLNHTRHTPRDFFQLAKQIQSVSHSNIDNRITENHISSGIRNYSINYFLPEIRDELAGYFDSFERDTIITSIENQGFVQFSYEEIKNSLTENGLSAEKIENCLATLFNCSAISNVRQVNGRWIYTAKYRNRVSSFKKSERIEVHKGLWKALNLSTGRPN